jgi:hypothetical protein
VATENYALKMMSTDQSLLKTLKLEVVETRWETKQKQLQGSLQCTLKWWTDFRRGYMSMFCTHPMSILI